ncbi:odorant receptor 4-like [Diabrotica virgifera virgifera]|uniref:Odorant receptor n=1 Tax=Diabrotica virgifera virgifera TaxID=50390 RepID=A0A6P7GLR4_DIAVI|nr:odorant receptor 4-like [Diabrotica virgifera virgifera]
MLSASQSIGAVAYQCYVHFEDNNVVFEGIIALADFVGYGFTYVNFKLNAEKIKSCTEKMSSVFQKFCGEHVLMEAEQEVKLVTKALLFYTCGGVVINSVLPMLEFKSCQETRVSDYYRIHDPCGMPVRTWYPFDSTQTGQYYFLVILHAYTCLAIASTVLCITMTLVGLMIHIIAQLRYLQYCILHAFDFDIDDPCLLRRKLHFCIQYHVTVINYATEVFGNFSLMLIVHVSLTSLVMGSLCFQIVYAENASDKLRFMLHLGGWVTMLFITCYYSQQIINESVSVADAAFDSKWYNAPLSSKRCLILIMMRSQKPLKLSAASVTVLSLQSFLLITKTAYSYFTLLLSMEQ